MYKFFTAAPMPIHVKIWLDEEDIEEMDAGYIEMQDVNELVGVSVNSVPDDTIRIINTPANRLAPDAIVQQRINAP